MSDLRPVAIANHHPRLRLERREIVRAVHLLDAQHARLATRRSQLGNSNELSIVFLTDPALAELHAHFLDDPTPTDVITFEGERVPGLPEAAGPAGEICVSVDTAARFARAEGRDFSTELMLYVVHGWLHLAGHDDLKPAVKRVMRRAEARAMAILTAADALPRFDLRRTR